MVNYCLASKTSWESNSCSLKWHAGVLPTTTPPQTGSLIKELHSLLPVSQHNQLLVRVAWWSGKVWKQGALNSGCWSFTNLIFCFKYKTSFWYVCNLLFSEHRFEAGVGSSCPQTKGGFEKICQKSCYTPYCHPKWQKPGGVQRLRCQHSEIPYERQKVWWHWI